MASFTSPRFVLLAFASALVAFGAGCASQMAVSDASVVPARADDALSPPENPTDLMPDAHGDVIVAIHRSKCGACHARVEPGTVSRATAESAMQRHRRRAKLTERQWEDMVDYLSADHVAHTRPTASVR